MKPPHSNRHGGAGPRGPGQRGPDKGPGRGFGGEGQRPQGGPPRGAFQQGRPYQGQPGGQGGRDDRPRQDGGAPFRPRQEGQGGRDDRPRQDGGAPFRPRQEGQSGRPFHGNRGDRLQHRPPHTPETPRGAVWLYGQHAVAAALGNPARRLRRLVLTEEAEASLATRVPQPWPLPPERADRGRLDHLLGRDITHQGVALLADPLPPPSLQQALDRSGPIVVLDQVTDPRNVGAILRSAAAFGAAAVITQDRNAPEETGALAKAASGALETMPLLRAVNIARTLIALKAANIWVVGLDAAAKAALAGSSFDGRRVALVLGAEDEGLRRLTRETCDELAMLPMRGRMESLNVSAAAAVALYELARHP
jgi:23S rRNA (guanosine2251-2'-O)-methyltransferase